MRTCAKNGKRKSKDDVWKKLKAEGKRSWRQKRKVKKERAEKQKKKRKR